MAQSPLPFQLGSFSCLICSDGHIHRSASNIFPRIDFATLEAACTPYNIPIEEFPIAFNFLYVDTGTDKVLIDTGRGEGIGELLPQLAMADINPEEIDLVILTHGHQDHVGNCISSNGSPLFPNARYVMRREEWDYWHADSTVSESKDFVLSQLSPLADRIDLIDHETEIIPGIIAISAVGHSPGHMVLFIRSGGEKLLHAADLMHHPIQLAHLGWATRFDMDPEGAADSRARILNWAIEQGCRFLFTHYPSPGLGKIKMENDTPTWFPHKF